MGFLTENEIKANNIQFVRINKEGDSFICGDISERGIEGHLLGFDSHDYEWKGKAIKKFDIYLKDAGITYQVQFGFYSTKTLSLLNSLLAIENIKNGGKLRLVVKKDKDGFTSVNIFWNNVPIKWKHEYASLKLKDLPEGKKETARDKIIDKWFAVLSELMQYKGDIHDNGILNNIGLGKEDIEDDDDLPF